MNSDLMTAVRHRDYLLGVGIRRHLPLASIGQTTPEQLEDMKALTQTMEQANVTLHNLLFGHTRFAVDLYDLCKRTHWARVTKSILLATAATMALPMRAPMSFISQNPFGFPLLPDAPVTEPLDQLAPFLSIDGFTQLLEPRRGEYLLCRAVSKPTTNKGLRFVAEDTAGNAFWVHAFTHAVCAQEWAATKVANGQVVAIKAPYFTVSESSWDPTIRCVHEANFVPIDDVSSPLLANTPWFVPPCETALQWVERANVCIRKKNFAGGIAALTRGLELNDSSADVVEMRASRAAALLALGKWQVAIDDTDAVLARDSTHLACAKARATALMRQHRHQDAADAWQAAAALCGGDSRTDKTTCDAAASAALEAERQSKGVFDWPEIGRLITTNTPFDVTTFLSPKVHRAPTTIQGRQFGMFAREAIPRGTLLLVESPMHPFRTAVTDIDAESMHTWMWDDVAKNIERDETKMAALTEMCNEAHIVASRILEPTDTTFGARLEIAFQSRLIFFCPQWQDRISEDHDKWIPRLCVEATRFNHSCMPNCARNAIGSIVIIQTTANIAAGSELFVAQCNIQLPLQSRIDSLEMRYFVCHCARCELERTHPMFERIKSTIQTLTTALSRGEAVHTRPDAHKLEELMMQHPRARQSFSGPFMYVFVL